MKRCQSLFIAAVLAGTAQGQSWDPDLEGGPRPSPLPLHYEEGARFATRLITLPGGGLQLGFIDALLPADTLPLVMKRRYFSGLTREGVLGAGWASTLDVRLMVDEAGGEIRIAEVDGKVSVYRSGGGKIEPVAAHFLQHTLSRAEGGFVRQWSDGAREQFDATGRLLKRSAGNDAITFTYEDAKAPLPSRVTDAAGRALDLVYQDGLLSQISDPLGRKTTFRHERRRLVEVTDAAGRVVRFAYDASGRLAVLTLPMGHKLAFEFNAEGHLTRVSGPAAINAAFAWQPVKDSPARELVTTFANGSTEKLLLSPGLYDPQQWNLPEVPEPRRAGLGFRIQRTDGTGASTSAFVMSGKVLMSDPALPGALAFDHQGRLAVSGASAPDPSAAAQALQEHAERNEAPFWRSRITPVLIPSSQPDVRYDAAGRAVEFVLAQGRTEKWRWDAADRVVEWTSAEGVATQQGYDAHNHLLTSVTDGKPGATFEYDVDDVLAAARDASDAHTTFAYDKAGNLSVATLPDGSKIQQTYDAASRLTSIVLPDGRAATFEYDAQGRVIKTTAPDGSTTSCAYDLQGRKTSETDAKGGVTRYTYDAFGRLASLTQPDGSVETYTWSDQGVALRSKSADGSETTEAYDRAGRLVHAQGPEGMEFKDSYDAAGRLLSRTDSIHGTTTFTYDTAGRKTTETQNGLTRSWHYDDQGRVASIDEGSTKATIRYLEGGGHIITTQAGDTQDEREYDAAGRVVAERDDLGQETRFTYDASGNLLRTNTSDGVTIAYEHDKAGHATNVTTTVKGATAAVSYTYDEAGNVTSIVKEDGTTEKFAYDAEGRVIEQVDGFGGVTRQEFDAAGRLVKVTSPHGVRSLKHDAQGRVVEDADPVEGTLRFDYSKPGEVTITDPEGFKMTRRANTDDQPLATVDPLGNTVQREYDNSGRLTAFVDPNQHKTTFAYPDDGRTVERRTAGGKVFRSIRAADGRPLDSSRPDGRTVTWEYDARGRLLLSRESDQRLWSYQYGPTGRLQSVEGSAGEFRYDFDPLDRLLSSRDPFGKEVAFAYDAPGRIETIRSPDGDTFAHRYNDKGLVASIESGMGMTRFEYDALGRLVGITHPNGMTVQQTYEAGSSLKSIEARDDAGTVLHKEEYSYDKRGNLTRLVDADGTSTFQYDGAGRLIKATHAGGPEEKFTYDAAGNVIASAEVADWKYDADNQLVAWNGQRIESDARGNVTALPDVGGFKWNAADQLTEVALQSGGTLSFAYDAEGRRVEKKSAAAVTRYAYAGEQLLAEYDGAGKQLALYVPGVEASLWLAVRLDGQEYYAIRSRLGSLVALADSKGRIVKRFRYDSYGRAFKTEGSVPLPPQFAGRPVDAETGLVQFGARLYSPQLKRFLTPDPAGPDKDGNTYAYALSNPHSFTDLAGTKGTPIIHSGPGLPRPPATGPLAAPKPSLIPGLSIRPRPLPPMAGTVPQNLPDFHRAVMDELRRTALSDPHGPSGYVARRTLDMINSGQVKLDIRSTDPLKEGALGRCPWGKNRVIIAREGHNTIRAAAATVVHEVAHVRQSMGGAAYKMGHEFQAEFRAWLVDKTLGTGRKVGVPELVDRVLKSYNAASGTPGNLTVKTVEREIRHFFPG
ncbi:MAG: RHS repeat-associated core domain-containing protein, partial [Prosthecobacter sp.]|nr:RHS repeat-associated core domain-containing protein [Prosthecobacter sp.]